ncbi:MAG: hypothetical protein AMXMBFR22_15160 [Phycisphaerae bacterium]
MRLTDARLRRLEARQRHLKVGIPAQRLLDGSLQREHAAFVEQRDGRFRISVLGLRVRTVRVQRRLNAAPSRGAKVELLRNGLVPGGGLLETAASDDQRRRRTYC